MASQIGFDTITVVPSADVATNGTLAFTYPAGRAQADYAQTGETLVSRGLQTSFAVGANNFSMSYGGSSVTLTYLGATSLPAGKSVTVQLPVAAYQALGASLTDSTTGVATTSLVDATSTFSQTKMNANFASLAAHLAAAEKKINMLIANAKLFDKIPS